MSNASPPPGDPHEREAARGDARPLRERLLWMAALWGGSVLVLGAVAWFLRSWIAG